MSQSVITLFGIPNCDTVKKARTWLSEQGVVYVFHDFKKDGLTAAQLEEWMKKADWRKLLNTRGTTWRKLPESDRTEPDADKARTLMLAQPGLIKRPVVEMGKELLVGFDPAIWLHTFKR